MDKLNIYQYCALRNEEDEPLQEKMNEPESYPILCQTQTESFLIPCAGATTPDATTGVQVCCSFFLSLTIPQATPHWHPKLSSLLWEARILSHISALCTVFSPAGTTTTFFFCAYMAFCPISVVTQTSLHCFRWQCYLPLLSFLRAGTAYAYMYTHIPQLLKQCIACKGSSINICWIVVWVTRSTDLSKMSFTASFLSKEGTSDFLIIIGCSDTFGIDIPGKFASAKILKMMLAMSPEKK